MRLLTIVFFSYALALIMPGYAYAGWELLLSDSLKHISIADSVSIVDTSKIDTNQIKKPRRVLFLIPKSKLTSTGEFALRKKDIDKLDYRYTGNILTQIPFFHLNNLGSTGLPSEPFIYGVGYGNSSFLVNGSSVNNRWKNSCDLYNIQTESIDIITLEPLSRGFLYNTINNPVTINIEESDSFKTKPISRIRYLQAPAEGYIDAMFSAKAHPRLALSFRLTNTSVDSGFANSSFDSWKANLKGIYKISKKLYTKLNYHHIKSKYGLNGGVNPESLLDLSNGLDNLLYNRTLATVLFYKRYNESTINKIDLDLFGNILSDNLSNIKFGYANTLEKFRQNSSKPIEDSTRISNDNQYSLMYGQFKQDFSISNFTSVFQARYEITDYNIDYLNFDERQINYHVWLLASYHFLDSLIIPSVYGKYLNYNNQSYNGFGFDIAIRKIRNFNLFFGLSNFGKPYSLTEQLLMTENIAKQNQSITTLFATVNYKNSFTNTSISYFNISTNNILVPVFNTSDVKLNSAKIIYPFATDIENQGVSINSKNSFGNFLYTLNLNYYFKPTISTVPYSPELTLTTGFYYVDTLYNNNLDLKTGFTFYLTKNFDASGANINYRIYDFQQFRSANSFMQNNDLHFFSVPSIENNINQLDFFLAGRIQNTATVYFVFENILGNSYFNIPFYPMRERGIKIGLSWDFIN